MRLPKHLFFNPPPLPSSSSSHVPHPATPPLSRHRDESPPPPTYTEAISPSLSRPLSRRDVRSSIDSRVDMDVLVRTETLPPSADLTHRRSAFDEPHRDEYPTVVVEDPNIIAMFLEDYKRTKEYMRELEWKVALRKALRRTLYKWYALLVIVITISALLSVKHEDVVHFCAPVTKRIREWPGGWMIPIAILIIVSFPPLIGHEIIGVLCGLVWGLGVGFAILAAGTFLGEIATWIAFKWFCTARAAKFEKKNKLYFSLTQLIREKSFMFVLVLRFSAVPGHITTAVSASAGANFWSYLAAAFLTLPKQLSIAYLGTAFGTKSQKNTIISVCTTIMTLIGTVIAAVYIYYQMRLVMRRQPTTIPALPTTMQEAAALQLDISASTLGRRATVAAIKSAPGEKDIWSHDLQARRPWLFAGQADDKCGLSRARSLPGPLNDMEMRGWQREVDGGGGESLSGAATPRLRLDGEGTGRWLDMRPGSWDRTLGSIYDDSVLLDQPTPLHSELDDVYPPAGPSRYTPRGTMSLDIPRDGTDRLGGREIADDADIYAISRGARRPEYGRPRGESRAALLGRPDWEGSDAGSTHRERFEAFKAERARSRDGADREEREERDTIDDGLLNPGGGMNRGKEREYGRPRGESGAALLGRPDVD